MNCLGSRPISILMNYQYSGRSLQSFGVTEWTIWRWGVVVVYSFGSREAGIANLKYFIDQLVFILDFRKEMNRLWRERPASPNNNDIYAYLQKIDARIDLLTQGQDRIIAFIQSLFERTDVKPSSTPFKQNVNSEIIDICPQPQRQRAKDIYDSKQCRSNNSHLQYQQQSTSQLEDVLFMHLNEVTLRKIKAGFNAEDDYVYEEQRTSTLNLATLLSQDIDLQKPQDILNTFQEEFTSMNLKFSHCETVYAYPDDANSDPMRKILDKNNVMVLMRLTSGQYIGAFSEVAFSSKDVLIPRDNPKSFLCNVTSRHFLYASKTNKTHSVDRNFLMFGNWQIKLRIGASSFESDVGKKGGCFMKESYGGRQMSWNTREWLFGKDSLKQKFELQKYVIIIFR